MSYLAGMEKTHDRFVDCLSREETSETIIYIHVGGRHDSELREALDAIYFDNSRDFRLVSIKENRSLLSAMIVMLPKTKPIKF